MGAISDQEPWRVLVVDDDPDVHAVTRMALDGCTFESRPVHLVSAHSAAEARRHMAEHPDVAMVLLDVVMESEHAGLEFVRHVRNELGNRLVRIVLRTGQAGRAPPRDVLTRYEIDDYLAKAELTHERLYIAVITALRGHALLRQLTRSNEELERYFAMSLNLVCIAGTDGYFRRLNPVFQETLGYTTEELLARPFIDFVHPEDVPATLAEVQKLAQGAPTLHFENRYRCKDGTYRWLDWTSQPTPDGMLYAIARDITGRKRMEFALREKNLELENARLSKDRFLATMSHELRTPLNAIVGFTGTLLMKLPGPLTADQEKQLLIIKSSARHLLDLINDLLDLAKVESGKLEIRREPVVCQSLIDEVATTLQPLADSKALRLEVRQPSEEIVVQTDRRALNQIVINLAGNAIKFTEKGTVGIELRQRHEGAALLTEICVSDTGPGIRSEDEGRLFQAFSQIDSSSTRHHEGTGLGLHLSQKLAELLGGRIACRSRPGKGSVFTLTLGSG